MSFSSEVKKELAEEFGKARHCQIAELEAFLLFCGSEERNGKGAWQVVFHSEHREVADKIRILLDRVLDREFFLEEEKDPKRGTVIFRVPVSGEEMAPVLQAMGIPDKGTELPEHFRLIHQPALQRNCCRRSFLRGAFLAAGSISDPNRSYHFEIVCDEARKASWVCELIRDLDIDANIVQRKKYFVVYVKESSQISDLLGLMGARVALLNFENIRVLKDVRGNVNRKVNCETANINKTANAAARQIEDIELIERTTGFSKLPNRLDEVAQIRLQYPTATLAELGRSMHPPLGKSGVNHRLRRLHEIANVIREEQGGNVQDG